MKVIKLGGSLITDPTSLTKCLTTIEQQTTDKVVIVPGGGLFADQVRTLQPQWNFNDKIAHHLAILAMHQTALLFNSIKPSFILAKSISDIQKTLLTHSTVIWMPDINELEASNIKSSWDICSDSLAAWIAKQLTTTDLVLVKSAEIPLGLNVIQMQQLGLLDKAFNEFSKQSSYKITLINKHRFNEYPFN